MKKLPLLVEKPVITHDEEDVASLRNIFGKNTRKTRSSPKPYEAKLLFFNRYRKIHKMQNSKLSTPDIALLRKLEQEKLQPLTLGMVKAPGKEDHINLNFMLSDRYAGALSKGLQHVKSLEKIDLKGNRLSLRGTSVVLSGLSSPILKRMNLSGNKIGYEGASKIAEMLQSSSCSIKSLDLEAGSISEPGSVLVFNALRQNSTVKHLNMSKNSLRDSSGLAIGKMLEMNTSLKSLDLHWNKISQTGGRAMFEGLTGNKTLTELDLSWNGLGNCAGELLKAMCDCLSSNRTLKHLDIAFNCINAENCALIAEAMCHNRTILGLHVIGNACTVDELGFVNVTELNASSKNPYSYRRILANEKNRPGENCWICEKWNDVSFVFPYQTEGPIFLHLSSDGFKPMQMQKLPKGFKLRRALPVGEYQFFFSDQDSQVFVVDLYPKRNEIRSLVVENCAGDQKHLHVTQVNLISSEPSRGIAKTKPREPLLSLVPKVEEETIELWDFNKSIFKNYILDTPDLLTRCFEFDWDHCKIPNFIKDENECKTCKELLRSNYKDFKNCYKLLSTYSFGELFSVSSNTFFDSLSSLNVFGASYGASDFGVNWKAAILQKQKSQIYNPGNALVRYEFLELFVRVAHDKYYRSKVTDSACQAINLLIEEFLPLFSTATFNDFKDKYFTEEVEIAIKENRKILNLVYDLYSGKKTLPGKKKFVSLEEFRDLCIALDCCTEGNTTREVDQAFCFAMMTQVNELYAKRHVEMHELEFYEALARLSDSVYKLEIPLHEKIRSMVAQLYNLPAIQLLKTSEVKPNESINTTYLKDP